MAKERVHMAYVESGYRQSWNAREEPFRILIARLHLPESRSVGSTVIEATARARGR